MQDDVPAAAGLIASTDLLAQSWLSIAVAILLSTTVAIAITGLVVQSALRLAQRRRAK